MALLPKAFDLPAAAGVVGERLGQTVVNYSVAGMPERMAEAARKVGAEFQALGPFSKLGAQTPTFDAIEARAVLDIAAAANAGAPLSGQARQDLARVLASGSPAPQASARQVNEIVGPSPSSDSHIVSLGDDEGRRVLFVVMPEIVEGRNVQYEAVAPSQFPGSFQKYKGTDAVQWTVNATFVARNSAEAQARYADLNTLRGWTMPYFGAAIQAADDRARKKLGAPPPVLSFRGFRSLIGPVPVVITSLNWNWPRDVDYIPVADTRSAGRPVPFPTVMSVAITLVEAHSTRDFNRFDLRAYRSGDMVGAYSADTGELRVDERPQAPATSEPRTSALAERLPRPPAAAAAPRTVVSPANRRAAAADDFEFPSVDAMGNVTGQF